MSYVNDSIFSDDFIHNFLLRLFLALHQNSVSLVKNFYSRFESIFKNGSLVIFVISFALVFFSLKNYKRTISRFFNVKTLQILVIVLFLDFLIGLFKIRLRSFSNIVISFSFMIRTMVSVMYGPIIGGIFAVMAGVLAFLLKPGANLMYLAIFNSSCSSMVLGIMLYDRDFSFIRILVSRMVISVLFNFLGLSCAFFKVVNKDLLFWLPVRLSKNLFLIPFETLFCYLFISIVNKILDNDSVKSKIGYGG